MRISRSDESLFTRWWFTVDRSLLVALFILVGVGLVFSLAASPAVADKKGYELFYFVERHAIFTLLGVPVMIVLSFLNAQQIRRMGLGLLVLSLILMVAALLIGPEINGAHRWIRFAGQSLQPSEFMKPGLVVITAWLLAEGHHRSDMPALPLALGLLGLVLSLLILQPDVGQSALIMLVWLAMFIVAGYSLMWGLGFIGAGGVAAIGAYLFLPHVRARITSFIDPERGDSYQIERALQSFREGGFFGRGPGEGTIKTILPDSHTDFIFSVIAEEYGIGACILLVMIFAFISLRALAHVRRSSDDFARLAVLGLALLFAVQTMINMAVNVGLMPAKGMPLPFISYGGSSFLGLSISMGFLLGMARRRVEIGGLKNTNILASSGAMGS